MRMLIFAIAVAAASFVFAQPPSKADLEKLQLSIMRSDVGKQFRPVSTNVEGLEFCPSVYGRFSECVVLSSPFVVTGLTLDNKSDGIHLAKFYRVRTTAGHVGYISYRQRDQFQIVGAASRTSTRELLHVR